MLVLTDTPATSTMLPSGGKGRVAGGTGGGSGSVPIQTDRVNTFAARGEGEQEDVKTGEYAGRRFSMEVT